MKVRVCASLGVKGTKAVESFLSGPGGTRGQTADTQHTQQDSGFKRFQFEHGHSPFIWRLNDPSVGSQPEMKLKIL